MWTGKQEPKGANAAALLDGQQTQIDLTTAVQNKRFHCTLTGDLTVTVASVAPFIVNRGSLWAAIDEIAIAEGGFKTWQQCSGRMLRFLTGCMASDLLPATRLTAAQAVVAATYGLLEEAVFNFANPLSMAPRETNYMELNSQQTFQVKLTRNALGVFTILAAGGGAAGTLTNVFCRVQQDYAVAENTLPYLRPEFTFQQVPVNGATAALRMLLQTQDRVRGIVIQQDTDRGEQSDIINSLRLRGDNGVDIIGPDQILFADLVRQQPLKFAGVDAGTPGYLFIDFQEWGRLSSVLYPNVQTTNLRFEFNCQPSVVAGATNSRINVGILSYTRPAPKVGKNVVTPELPAFLDLGGVSV